MIRQQYFLARGFRAISVCLLCVAAACQAAQVRTEVDWPEFLARHDLVWESLPKQWDEGAFIGNGLLGAMIYSDETNVLQWDVGQSDVIDRGDRIAIGRFALVPDGKADEGTMRLDLWNAEARGTLVLSNREAGRSVCEWRSFTHADKMLNVIELNGDEQHPAEIVFQHLPAYPARAEYRKESVPDDQLNPDATFGETEGVSWCLQAFKAGGGYAVAWGQRKLSSGKRLFLWTVDFVPTGAPATDQAVADVRSALKADFADLEESHRDWWHAYFPRSFLSIPDTRMESFYWIQMYKLASATRADRMVIDLMGPWFRRTPWAHLWWNLNIQLTYWPVYAANRLELGESLTRLIDDNRENLINNVPEEWRSDSAGIGRSSPYDCKRRVSARPGEERGDLTWALHNYWLQYRYSGDEEMLRDRLYPILKRSIAYYLHLLERGDDGKLHVPLSLSPEYPDKAPDTNYDLSLLRWGLQTLLATNERFSLRDSMAPKWRETLKDLAPFPVDPASGYMIGAGVPFEKSHRHFSHLLMFYPLHLVDPESPADRPLLEKSLEHWQSLMPALRGYSYTGAAAMYAWLGEGQKGVDSMNNFLEFREGKAVGRFPIRANTMYTEAGPVIETPLSGAASVHEFLLQSWTMGPFGTHIRIFPAVPDSWKDVSFDKLLAEGAFEVSAVRRGGKTQFVQIKSLAGAPCHVRTGLEEPIVASGSRAFKVTTGKDRNGLPLTTVDLQKGETVLLTSGKNKPDPEDMIIKAVAPQPDRLNFYGSPKN